MPDSASSESELADQLKAAGCAVGRSKSGRLLRVDNRECPNQLQPDLLRQVLACTALKELYLRGSTEFLNHSVDSILALTKLKVLDVEGSDFSDDSLEQLAACNSLQVLNVRSTAVTQACVVRMRKVLIDVRIIF